MISDTKSMSLHIYVSVSFSCTLSVFVLVMLVLNTLVIDINAAVTLKKEELPEFFKSSYILKQPGYVQPVDQTTATVSSKKNQYAHGFNPMWNIFRLHHVRYKFLFSRKSFFTFSFIAVIITICHIVFQNYMHFNAMFCFVLFLIPSTLVFERCAFEEGEMVL